MPFNLERIKNALQSIHHCWLLHSTQDLTTEELTEYQGTGNLDLIRFLSSRLKDIEQSEWPARLAWGSAYVNGLVCYKNKLLELPAKIDYYEPKHWDQHWDQHWDKQMNSCSLTKTHNFNLQDLIVYEDQWLIALNKPEKFHVLPAKEQQHLNLRSILEKHYNTSIHFPSRLDYSTSGLIICSKHQQMHAGLQQLFERRQIQKTYLALGTGKASWNTCLISKRICKDPRHPILRKTSLKDGLMATTELSVIRSDNQGTLFEARPLTGRTHQIRVHLETLGNPIVGDIFYGALSSDPTDIITETLRLLSYKLKFQHPILNSEIALELTQSQKPHWAIT